MVKHFRNILLLLALCLAPMGATADPVQLAKWSFDTGYTVEENVYTPNDDAWAQIGWNGFGTLPRILPNAFTGNQADYYVSAKGTRFWGIMENYDSKILSLYQDMDPNNISDYSDASQHNQYFEIGFPTKGYKNVQFSFAFTCGDNNARSMEMVVSTDGGSTWNAAGAYAGAANWWIYNTSSVALSANNKEQVIVRLIAPNEATAQWRMNEISISAEEADAPVVVSEQGFTLSWPLKEGAASATTATATKDGMFSVAEMSVGDKLLMNGTRTDGGICETMFQPVEQAGAQEDGNAITFTLKPKKGLTFTPKSFAFHASRVGTNAGNFDVVAVSNGTPVELAKDERPQLVKESPYFTEYNYDLSNIAATDDVLTLKIFIRGVATNKQYAFSDVIVTGDVAGTIEAVSSYTFAVSLGTDGAGKVSTNPAGSEFDEGTVITATATENFGYHFAAWVDENNDVVSTDNPYSFEIGQNTTLVATYTKNNVYALNLNLVGGANDNLVQVQPTGNYVDGIHYYEEGTDVKLTALNNRILTFTGWEGDAEGTSAVAEVKMTGEKSVTANFSATDFIVGWDLYYDQPAKDRAADYKADTENAGILSLRKADGSTNGWLTRGIGNGQENGKYAARIWKYLSEEWYFEIQFSSKGYENLSISSCIGDDYNTYSVNNVQYSVDGENFTTIGTFNPPARGWDGPKEFQLPAEANNQERVWIRWMPDRTSEKVGVASDYDGTSIAEIFVLGELSGAADQQATLVSSNPAEGADDVSANGSIILSFDNKVKMGTGTATLTATALDGSAEELTPIVSGKSAVFKYSGLKYATAYTFTMPEGVLVSRSGQPVAAVTLNFTTMERKQPEMRLYDAVVDAAGTVPAGFAGEVYTSVQAAIDAAPAGSAKPWLIFIKNGDYKEHVDIPKTKPYIHLIGQDRDKAVIKDDRMAGGENAQHVSVAATVVVNADNCFFENLTMENIYGHEQQAGPQALALNTIGDRIALNGVALLSYQDTWITTSTQKNRHYIKNSLIEGAVDFIYNGGDVYLDGDTLEINRPSGGYIVAPNHTADSKWGYVFQNTVIRPRPGVNVTDVWLGRPWHGEPKTVFINTQTFINIPAKGWYNTMGGLPALWADYNTVDANGNPVDLSQRETYYYYIDSNTGQKVEKFNVKNFLTAEEAAEYTIKNVCSGDDNWQPDLMCEACEMPVVSKTADKLTWSAVPYAICYVVTCGDEVVGFTTETEYAISDADAIWKVQAVNEYGGLSLKSTAIASRTLSITDAGIATYYGDQAITIPEGVTAYWGKLSADNSELQLNEITDGVIPANTAVVLKGAENDYAATLSANAGSIYAENVLKGVLTETATPTDGTVYVLGKNHKGEPAFCQFTGNTLAANRAYLLIATDNAREVVGITFGQATGIDAATMLNGSPVETKSVYNLQGQRINVGAGPVPARQKGLYIVNGKKIVKN